MPFYEIHTLGLTTPAPWYKPSYAKPPNYTGANYWNTDEGTAVIHGSEQPNAPGVLYSDTVTDSWVDGGARIEEIPFQNTPERWAQPWVSKLFWGGSLAADETVNKLTIECDMESLQEETTTHCLVELLKADGEPYNNACYTITYTYPGFPLSINGNIYGVSGDDQDEFIADLQTGQAFLAFAFMTTGSAGFSTGGGDPMWYSRMHTAVVKLHTYYTDPEPPPTRSLVPRQRLYPPTESNAAVYPTARGSQPPGRLYPGHRPKPYPPGPGST